MKSSTCKVCGNSVEAGIDICEDCMEEAVKRISELNHFLDSHFISGKKVKEAEDEILALEELIEGTH